MAQIAYINYNDVVKAIEKSENKTKNIQDFYKNNEFLDIFENIFKFNGKKQILIKMLKDWDKNIKKEIKLPIKSKKMSNNEIFEIYRLSLKEITTIANIGKFSINKLNLLPEIALAFCLGIYYANFIFEQTCYDLTIYEIYDIIPKNVKEKNNFETFQKLFLINGTSKEIINILFNN